MSLAQLPSELQARIIKLQSCEKALFEIDKDTVNMCNTVKQMLKGSGKRSFRNILGGTFTIEENGNVILKKEGRLLASTLKNTASEVIILFHEVTTSIMAMVLEFCRFHSTDLPIKDKKQWNAKFVEVDQSVLCDLASASYYMDIEPLVNLTSRAIATQVSGKSTDEIRETFYNANCDVHSSQFATRYRLQKRIRNKNKDETPPAADNAGVEDDRTVEDILSFINSSEPSSKSKKKRQRRKEQQQPAPQAQTQKPQLASPKGKTSQAQKQSQTDIKLEDDLFSEELFEEEERTIDPDFKAKVDREVEEWRLKLEQISTQYQGPKVKLPTDIYLSSIGVK